MSGESETQKKKTSRSAVLSQRPEYERLGAWLRQARESKGMEQKPLSRKLGKPDQFMNKVEAGKQRIDLVEFLDLANALELEGGLSIEFFTAILAGKSL